MLYAVPRRGANKIPCGLGGFMGQSSSLGQKRCAAAVHFRVLITALAVPVDWGHARRFTLQPPTTNDVVISLCRCQGPLVHLGRKDDFLF